MIFFIPCLLACIRPTSVSLTFLATCSKIARKSTNNTLIWIWTAYRWLCRRSCNWRGWCSIRKTSHSIPAAPRCLFTFASNDSHIKVTNFDTGWRRKSKGKKGEGKGGVFIGEHIINTFYRKKNMNKRNIIITS